MTALLHAKGLKKRFGGNEAVKDVSFEVNEGECVVLAGDNGAGKSTVIKMISGVYTYLYLPIIVTPQSFAKQLIMLIAGIIVFGIGLGLYISSDFGAGPRDALMLALTELTKFKVQHVRFVLELFVLCIGWLLGGPVFIGTVIITVMIGPVVGFTLPFFRNVITKLTVRGDRGENLNERALRPNDYDGISEKLR